MNRLNTADYLFLKFKSTLIKLDDVCKEYYPHLCKEKVLETRYRVKELVNYPERPAKDYIDRSGRHRRLSHKPASKGLLNIAESTFWKMIRRGDFPEPTYLTASMPTWSESQIKEWLGQKQAA